MDGELNLLETFDEVRQEKVFYLILSVSLQMHVTLFYFPLLWTQHDNSASLAICNDQLSQMAHWICCSQWHCSFDIIPKHWHPLNLPSCRHFMIRSLKPPPPSPTVVLCDARRSVLLCSYLFKMRVLNHRLRKVFKNTDASAFFFSVYRIGG